MKCWLALPAEPSLKSFGTQRNCASSPNKRLQRTVKRRWPARRERAISLCTHGALHTPVRGR
jgi:hypothetical protein